MIEMPRDVKTVKSVASPRGNQPFGSASYVEAKSKLQRGRYLPTFSHTRIHNHMTSYDDDEYIIIRACAPWAAGSTGIQTLAGDIVDQGHTSGNMKDKVDDEETAYKQVSLNALRAILDCRIQHQIRTLMADYAEADETGGSNTSPAVWTLATFNQLMTEIDGKHIMVPNWVLKLADDFLFYVQLGEQYTIGTVRTPPSYFIPYISDAKYSEMASYLGSYVYTYNGESKIYMDKFGVKYKELKSSDLTKPLTMYKGWRHPEVLAFLCHSSYHIYDNASIHLISPDGVYANDAIAADHASRKFYFVDKPDEAPYHLFTPLLNEYNADKNKYGWLDENIYHYSGGDDDDNSFEKAKYLEDTSFTGGTNTSMWYILKQFAATYQQSAGHSLGDTSGFLNLSLTGSKLAADIDIGNWPLAMEMDCFYGTGLTKSVIENALLNYCIANAF
jgi:hypothetical protein